jgi:hypothetical protein
LAIRADSSVWSAVSTAHGRSFGVVLGRYQLVGSGNAHRLGHTGQPVGVQDFEYLFGADDPDDGAHHPATDECLTPVGVDVGYDYGDVGVSGAGRHHDDHGVRA